MISKTVDNRYHFSIVYVLDTYRWEIPNYYYMKNMSLKFLGSGYISKGYIIYICSVGRGIRNTLFITVTQIKYNT